MNNVLVVFPNYLLLRDRFEAFQSDELVKKNHMSNKIELRDMSLLFMVLNEDQFNQFLELSIQGLIFYPDPSYFDHKHKQFLLTKLRFT